MITTFRPKAIIIGSLITAATLALTSTLALAATLALTANATPRGQYTTAQLRARLLVSADLPGWQNYQFVPDFPNGSNRPACLNAIDGLDSANAPRGVTEAQAAFAQSASGPWILQTLRSYPGNASANAVSAATATLSGCRSFALYWNGPPEVATETIQPMGSVHLGNQSWAAEIAVNSVISDSETLILVRVGNSTMLLEVATAAGVPMPTFAQAKTIAARAVSNLTH
jgi:hypothetical protein